MRKIFYITAFILLSACYLNAAQLSFFIGDVSVTRGGKLLQTSSGMELQSGDILKTGSGSTADIMYKDGSKISIKDKSTATIGNAGIKGSDNVSLSSGNIFATFKKMGKDPKKKVYTPTAVASVRGTEFKVSVSKSGETRVELDEGNLDLNNPYGDKKLEPGDMSETNLGDAPSKATNENTESWNKSRNKNFEDNPSDAVKKYDDYNSKLNERNDNAGKETQKINGQIKKSKKKNQLSEAGDKISDIEEKVQDDMMQNQAASLTINDIVNDYKSRKENIYTEFERIKSELNKVQEVQKMNYEAIQNVKEAHKKALQEITDKFKKDQQDIKDILKSDKIKPVIEKY
jgi:hypothetical protein